MDCKLSAQLAVEMLDWVAETSIGGTLPPLDTFANSRNPAVSDEELSAAVASLKQRGLVESHRSMGGVRSESLHLTDAGRILIASRRERRS